MPAYIITDSSDEASQSEESIDLFAKPKILIFEPNFERQLALDQLFVFEFKLGTNFETCSDATEILTRVEELHKDAGHNQVALIVVAQNMPHMAGTDLVRAVRQFLVQ